MAAPKTQRRAVRSGVNKPQNLIQPGIQAFTKVTKAQSGVTDSKKRKSAFEEESPRLKVVKHEIASVQKDVGKRKRGVTPDSDSEAKQARNKDTIEESGGEIALFVEKRPQRSNKKRRTQRQTVPRPDTPTKGTSNLLAGLALDSTPAKKLAFNDSAYGTPVTSPENPAYASEDESTELPHELQNLLSLHASFLTSLSLHYAHNGTATPVDLNTLMPSISKLWRKRRVLLLDLRRTLHILQTASSNPRNPAVAQAANLKLADYGRGKICLEMSVQRNPGLRSGHIDENALNALFTKGLMQTWTSWRSSPSHAASPAEDFVAQLPLAPITVCASIAKVRPLLQKGQQRLEDLKTSTAQLKASETAKRDALQQTSMNTQNKTPAALQNRATALLDRILAKQSALAFAPAGPNKEQQERAAALHRVEEVVGVLGLLAAGKGTGLGRVSFGMQALCQAVQGSVRNSISVEEAGRVVRVIADEVAPGFVKLVRTGSVVGVVISLGGRVGGNVLRERVRVCLEG